MPQLNVELPAEIIAKINEYQARMLREKAKRIKKKDIVLEALKLWFLTDLGFSESFEQAKIEKARLEFEKDINGKPVIVELSREELELLHEQIHRLLGGEAKSEEQPI